MIYFLFIFSLVTASAADQATLVLKNGANRTGEIVFADDHQIRLKIALGDQGDATATVSIPRSALESIDFESDPAMEELLASPNPFADGRTRCTLDEIQPLACHPPLTHGTYRVCSGRIAAGFLQFQEREKSAWNF